MTTDQWAIGKIKKLDSSLFGKGLQQIVVDIITLDGLKIASVYDTAFVDTNKKNIKLIAAAPQMLHLLKLCLDHGNLGTFGKNSNLTEMVEDLITHIEKTSIDEAEKPDGEGL